MSNRTLIRVALAGVILAGCGTQDERALTGSAAEAVRRRDLGAPTTLTEYKTFSHLVDDFLTLGFQPKCGGATPSIPCLNSTKTAPQIMSCWIGDSCSAAGNTALVRPDATASAILQEAASYLSSAVRLHLFDAPAGHKSTDRSWWDNTPGSSASGTTWGLAEAKWFIINDNLSTINYHFGRYYIESMDRVVITIEPMNWNTGPDASGRNWGMFVFNTHPTSWQLIEVPHAKADLNSELIGEEAFERVDAFAFFISGAHRFAIDTLARETGTNVLGKADVAHEEKVPDHWVTGHAYALDSLVTSDSPLRIYRCTTAGTSAGGPTGTGTSIADGATLRWDYVAPSPANPGDSLHSAFELMHEAVLSQGSAFYSSGVPTKLAGRVNLAVVQLHGFDESGHQNTIVSSGVKAADGTVITTGMADDVTARINGATWAFTNGAKVAGTSAGVTAEEPTGGALEGTTNVQSKSTAAAEIPFLHVESDGMVRGTCTGTDGFAYNTVKTNADDTGTKASSCGLSGPRDAPAYAKVVGRAIAEGVDDWLADIDTGLLGGGSLGGSGWLCPPSGVQLGLDKEVTPDVSLNTDSQNYPFLPTLMAQRRRGPFRFIGFYLESSGYPPYSESTGELWAGHRGDLLRMGYSIFPIYKAPDPPSSTAGATDAANAVVLADKEGFTAGTTIFLDLESNTTSDTSPYVQYVKDWFHYMSASQPVPGKYKMGVYCSDLNCDWVMKHIRTLTSPAIADADVVYWVYDDACTSRTGTRSTVPSSTLTYAGSPGCFAPVPGDSSYGSIIPAYKPTNTGIPFAGMWQYAQSPRVSTDCSGSGFGYQSKPKMADGGFLPEDDPTKPSEQECRTPTLIGDYGVYDTVTDLDSMTVCDSGGTFAVKYPPPGIKRFPFTALTRSARAQALAGYLANPQGVSIATTAQTMGVDLPVVYALQEIYNRGGAKVVDNTLTSNVDDVPVVPASPIDNPSFESGTLEGWTSSGVAAAVVDGNSFVARLGTTSPTGNNSISQSFEVPPTGSPALTFSYSLACNDAIQYDQFWVTLYDVTTATTYTVQPQICTNDGSWKMVDYDVTALAGHNVTLTIQMHDDGAPGATYVKIDDVALSQFANGTIERASLTGWTTTGVTATVAGSANGRGSYVMQVGSTSPSTDSTSAQTFTVPTAGASELDFTYKVVCLDTVTYAYFWVTVTDLTTGSQSVQIVAPTCTNNGMWNTVHYDVTGMLGHQMSLVFHNHDDNYPNDPIYALVDNVVVR